MSTYLAEYLSSQEIRQQRRWSLTLVYKLASTDRWRKVSIGRRTYYHALDVAKTADERAGLDT